MLYKSVDEDMRHGIDFAEKEATAESFLSINHDLPPKSFNVERIEEILVYIDGFPVME